MDEYGLLSRADGIDSESEVAIDDGDLELFQLVLDKTRQKINDTPRSQLTFADLQSASTTITEMTKRKRIHLLGTDAVNKHEHSAKDDKPIEVLKVVSQEYLDAL